MSSTDSDEDMLEMDLTDEVDKINKDHTIDANSKEAQVENENFDQSFRNVSSAPHTDCDEGSDANQSSKHQNENIETLHIQQSSSPAIDDTTIDDTTIDNTANFNPVIVSVSGNYHDNPCAMTDDRVPSLDDASRNMSENVITTSTTVIRSTAHITSASSSFISSDTALGMPTSGAKQTQSSAEPSSNRTYSLLQSSFHNVISTLGTKETKKYVSRCKEPYSKKSYSLFPSSLHSKDKLHSSSLMPVACVSPSLIREGMPAMQNYAAVCTTATKRPTNILPKPSKSSLSPNILPRPSKSSLGPDTSLIETVLLPVQSQSRMKDLLMAKKMNDNVQQVQRIDTSQESFTQTPDNTHATLTSNNNQAAKSSQQNGIRKELSKITRDTLQSIVLDRDDLLSSDILDLGIDEPSTTSTSYEVFPYQCCACKDNFHSKSGLEFHMKRKIFDLKYYCNYCVAYLNFNNKCQFWKHLKDESNISAMLRVKNGKSMLKLHMLPSYQYAAENKEYDALVDKCIHLDNDEKECPGCKRTFPNMHALGSHMSQLWIKQVHICTICRMKLPNACSLLAHRKIHSLKNSDLPLVWCPECGRGNMNNVRDGFNSCGEVFEHLDECNHFNRVTFISCKCNEKFVDPNSLKLHIITSHMQVLYYCTYCPLALNYTSLLSHCKTVHKKYPLSVKPVLFCKICKSFHNNSAAVIQHLSWHYRAWINSGQSMLKWKCFSCDDSFPSKEQLKLHVEKTHPYKAKRCTMCFALFSSRKNLVDHIVMKKCTKRMLDKLNLCSDIPKNNDKFCSPDTIVDTLSDAFKIKVIPVVQTNTALTSNANQSVRISEYFQSTPRANHTKKTVDTPANEFQHLYIHQCHDCKVIIRGFNNVSAHLKQHEQLGSPTSKKTQCVVCKKLLDNWKLYTHLLQHQRNGIKVCCKCQRTDFATIAEAVAHGNKMCGYKLASGPGDINVLTAKNTQEKGAPRKSVGGADISNVEDNDYSGDTEVEDGDEDDSQLVDETPNSDCLVVPCLLCGITFGSQEERSNHMSRIHEGTRTVYYCVLCQRQGREQVFRRRQKAVKHLTSKHRVVAKERIMKLIKTREQNVSNGEEVTSAVNDMENGDEAPPTKRLRMDAEGDFLCGKCAFSCSDSEEFAKHIVTHNTKKEPQCPECGLCFTVTSALKRHLLAVHKIKSIDAYMEKKGLLETESDEHDDTDYDDQVMYQNIPPVHPEDDLSRENSNGATQADNPLQCTVCYKILSSESVLRTHMRKHGMAFLKSHKN